MYKEYILIEEKQRVYAQTPFASKKNSIVLTKLIPCNPHTKVNVFCDRVITHFIRRNNT